MKNGPFLEAGCAALLSLGAIFLTFAKFGLLSFGGGYVLVPIYIDEFVGPGAPFLQLPEHEFGNLIAITQMTPGPISVNAATFFGTRIAGIPGAIAATAGLILPSFFLMIFALRSLQRWKENALVRGLLWGVAPATIGLMLVALVSFLEMSVFDGPITWEGLAALVGHGAPEPASPIRIRPFAVLLVAASTWALLKTKLQIVTIIFACAAVGALVFPFLGS